MTNYSQSQNVVARHYELEQMITAITQQRITVLYGKSGQGKTILAQSAREAMHEQFPDGILWTTLGPHDNMLQIYQDVIMQYKNTAHIPHSENIAYGEMFRCIRDKQILLICDDVRTNTDAQYILTALPNTCHILFLTCNQQLLPNEKSIELGLMSRNESRELLIQSSGRTDIKDTEWDLIAEHLGYFPLALKMAGALLTNNSWKNIAHIIENAPCTPIEPWQQKIFAVMRAAISVMEPELRQRYAELVIFPEGVAISAIGIARLWQMTGNMTAEQSNEALRLFRANYLIETDGTLHKAQQDYLHTITTEEQRQVLHRKLAASYGDPDCWAALPEEADQYGWKWLAWHVLQAKEEAQLRNLLLNATYCQLKIANAGCRALIADMNLIAEDQVIQQLKLALQIGQGVLEKYPEELQNQIYGRNRELKQCMHTWQERKPPYMSIQFQSLPIVTENVLKIFEEYIDDNVSCAFSPDGHHILGPSWDDALRVWELQTGRTIQILDGHEVKVNCCAYSPNGRYALSGSWDQTLRVWNLQTGQTIQVLKGHTEGIVSCAFSPDGKYALSGSWDTTLRVWDTENWQTAQILNGHTGGIHACAYSPNGKHALSASEDKTLRVWDLASGKTIQVLKGHTEGVHCCAYHPDGRSALSGSGDNTLRVWDLQTGQMIQVLEGHTEGVTTCAYSLDGKYVLSASDDGTLRVWDLQNRQIERIVAGHTGAIDACAYSPDGHHIVSVSRDVREWNCESGKMTRILGEDASANSSCAYSPDGKYILIASYKGILRIRERKSGQVIKILEGHTGSVYACAYSPDGKYALSASGDTTLRVWNTESGQTVQIFNGHTRGIHACAYSPDGKYTLSGSPDGRLRVWETESWQTAQILEGHTRGIHACTYSPDGKYALSASEDKTLRVWDLASGKTMRILEGHTRGIYACAYSPDGKHALSGSADGTLQVWETQTGQPLAVWHYGSQIRCCAFSHDGTQIICGGDMGVVQFLKLEGI